MDTNPLPKAPIHFQHMTWFDRSMVFCAVGFGSGLMPKAPGTFGSAFALLFVPLWLYLGLAYSIAAVVLISMVGIYICGHAAKVLHVHDDGRIVWDEFAGQSIALLPLLYLQQMNALWVLLGLILFRLFDVWKPFPIGWADRHVSGGLGIMLDDIIAGVLAALCLFILNFYFFN